MLTTLSQSTLRIELSVLRDNSGADSGSVSIIPPVSRPIFFARERREVRLWTIDLIRISEVRGHFPVMASHNLREAFFPARELAPVESGNPYPADGTQVCGFPFQRGGQG
jgi:hypothetical protein